MQGSLKLESQWYHWLWSNLFRLTEAPEITQQKKGAKIGYSSQTEPGRKLNYKWQSYKSLGPFYHSSSFSLHEIIPYHRVFWILSTVQGQQGARKKMWCCYFSSEKRCFIPTDLSLQWLLNSSLLRSHLDLQKTLFCAAEKSNHNSM